MWASGLISVDAVWRPETTNALSNTDSIFNSHQRMSVASYPQPMCPSVATMYIHSKITWVDVGPISSCRLERRLNIGPMSCPSSFPIGEDESQKELTHDVWVHGDKPGYTPIKSL